MKDDKLDQGKVYRTLEDELSDVKSKIHNAQSTSN